MTARAISARARQPVIAALMFLLALALNACSTPGALPRDGAAGGDTPYPYFLSVPDAPPPGGRHGVLIFLHGSGERGSDIDRIMVHGPPRLLREGAVLPFIVVAPQLESGGDWSVARLDATLAAVRRRLRQSHIRIDRNRIVLTGLSLGGHASWRWAAAHPRLFAAVAPIAGRGDPATACALVDVPVHAFHGSDDTVVAPSGSIAMVDAIRACGGTHVQLTLYPATGHDSWTRSYADPALMQWLAAQHRVSRRR